MEHHRLPTAEPEPVAAPTGNEIRFPAGTGCSGMRAKKENQS